MSGDVKALRFLLWILAGFCVVDELLHVVVYGEDIRWLAMPTILLVVTLWFTRK